MRNIPYRISLNTAGSVCLQNDNNNVSNENLS